MQADYQRRLWVAAPLTVVIVALSMVHALQFSGWEYIVAALTLPVVTWAAWRFHSSAFRAARHGSTTMDTLVSLGVITTSLYSYVVLALHSVSGGAGHAHGDSSAGVTSLADSLWSGTFLAHHGAPVYFEGAATIVSFLLIGKILEARAKQGTGDALRALMTMQPDTAMRLTDPNDPDSPAVSIPIDDLHIGDLFRVLPGEKVATDGVVVSGNSAVDSSLLTGESLPVDVSPGDQVIGATINTWGSLVVRATEVGKNTTLAQMARTLSQAQSGKAPIQRIADQISGVFVPVVLGIAALTLVGWLLADATFPAAVSAAVSVLVVACPCALGLATPTALLTGTSRAAQHGIIIRSPEVVEVARRLTTVVFDKTGTLTTGNMDVHAVHADHGVSAAEVLRAGALVEGHSTHPLASAIIRHAEEITGEATALGSEFVNHAGRGVSAFDTADGSLILAGRTQWLADLGLTPSEAIRDALDASLHHSSLVAVARIPATSLPTELHLDALPLATDTPPTVGGVTAGGSTADGAPTSTNENTNVRVPGGAHIIELAVGNMTCASCVRRVERKLGKVEGVNALVNLATESATVILTGNATELSDAEIEQVVINAGYDATVTSRTVAGDHLGNPAGTHSATDTSGSATPTNPGKGMETRDFATGIFSGRGQVLGVIELGDTIKPEATRAITELRELGLTPILLTGDSAASAQHVATQLGIERVHAQVLPADKFHMIERLQADGECVVMVGDGVNDAAALTQASSNGIGMAMGSGTAVAIASADMTLMNSSPLSVPTAVRICRSTVRVIRQNLFWAFAYNIAMIPLAIAGALNPMVASAAMAFSSVFVVTNSLRLRRQ